MPQSLEVSAGSKADAAWISGNGSMIALLKAVASRLGAGISSALNLTAASVVKTGAGRLCRVVIINPGTTGGTFTLNDCATVGAAAAANTIFSVAFNGTGVVAGASFDIQMPVTNGIVLSAVPTGGTPIIAVSYQ
jgi:hypothetical protein